MKYYWINKNTNYIIKAFDDIYINAYNGIDLCSYSGHLGNTVGIKIMDTLDCIYKSCTAKVGSFEFTNILKKMLAECDNHRNNILINDLCVTGKTHKNRNFEFFDSNVKDTITIKQMEIEPIKIDFADEFCKFSITDFMEKYKLCYDLNQLKNKLNLDIGLYELYMKTDLDLSYKNLTTLPNEILTLSNLRHINLYGNNLTILPNKFVNLSNLQFISLEEHQLSIIPYDFFAKILFRYLRSNAQSTESREAAKLNYFRLYEKELTSSGNKIINLIIYQKNNIGPSIDVKVLDVIWNTGKDDYLYPIITFNEVYLAGVMVSKVSAFNAKYVMDNRIGPGSIVRITLLNDFSPTILSILSKSSNSFPKTPSFPCEFTDSKIHIVPKIIDENISINFNGTRIQNLTHALEYYQKMVSENNPRAEKFKKVIKCFTIL